MEVSIFVRVVRSRLYPNPRTYMAELRWRVGTSWCEVGTTRGHATREDAKAAGRKLAARRGYAVVGG